jgi:hypothetical protein
MSNYTQRPGTLNLSAVAGDEFSFTATIDINLTGYTVTSKVFRLSDSTDVETPTLVVTHGSGSSTVKVTLSETQTTAIYAATDPIGGVSRKRVRWYLRIVSAAGYTTTILSGDVVFGVP